MPVPLKYNRREYYTTKEKSKTRNLAIVAKKIREARLSHLKGEEMDSLFGMTPTPYYGDTYKELCNLLSSKSISFLEMISYLESRVIKEGEVEPCCPPEVWYDKIFFEGVMDI